MLDVIILAYFVVSFMLLLVFSAMTDKHWLMRTWATKFFVIMVHMLLGFTLSALAVLAAIATCGVLE